MDNFYLKVFFDTFHIMATITWFGALFTNILITQPTIRKTLDASTSTKFMSVLMQRVKIVVYISLAVLFITGIPMKIANENYVSIINFSNDWQIFMFIKHVIVALLALLVLYNFEILTRKIKKALSNEKADLVKQIKTQQAFWGKVSALLALIIIIFSAIMNYI